jgi:cytidylate kinase
MSTPIDLLQHQADMLEVAERHWQARRENKVERKGITIALARAAGAPGTTVASEVGKRLNWPVYDHLLLERIAKEMGLRTQLVESVDERRRSWLLEMVEGFVSADGVSELSYVRHLTQTILSLAEHGECVIVGRGAAQILPPKTTLRVRLDGDLDDRIAAVSSRLSLSRDKAAKWVADTEHRRETFIKDHFLKSPADARYYDLILNTSTWSVADCTDLILCAVKSLENSL